MGNDHRLSSITIAVQTTAAVVFLSRPGIARASPVPVQLPRSTAGGRPLRRRLIEQHPFENLFLRRIYPDTLSKHRWTISPSTTDIVLSDVLWPCRNVSFPSDEMFQCSPKPDQISLVKHLGYSPSSFAELCKTSLQANVQVYRGKAIKKFWVL